MKKSLLTLLGAGLLLTSCQSDEPFAPGEGGEKQVTFTLNVPGELGTRAGAADNASDKGGWTNSQGNLSYTLVLRAANDVQTLTADAQGREVIFTPTVVLGRNYTVTAYAYFGDTAKGSIDAIAESKGINDETKDAYTWTGNINFATDQDGTNQNITLKRPYAKLRLIATDYNEAKTDVESVTVEYKNQMYTMFNAVEGQFNAERAVSFTNTWNKDYYEKATTDGSKTIFADYVPVNETGYAPFTVTVEYKNGETYTRTFAEDIPVKRNALTTLKGAFFTAGAQITVNVDDNFENEQLIEETVTVTNAAQLTHAIATATDNTIIYFADDITGNATAIQKEGIDVIIDGRGHKYDGTIYIQGQSRNNGQETLTIQNVNFETLTSDRDFISANSTIESERYAHNVIVRNCSFESNITTGTNNVVAMRYRQTYNMKVENCVANNLFLLMWASGNVGTAIDGVTVNNQTGEGGVSIAKDTNVVIKNSTINAAVGYGIRAGGENATSNTVSNLSVENTTIDAKQPIVVRYAVGNHNVVLSGADLITNELYHVIFTKGNNNATYVAPEADAFTISGADDYNVYPTNVGSLKVATNEQLKNAIAKANAGDTIYLLDGTYSGEIDLTGKNITLKADGNNVKFNGVVWADNCTATLEGIRLSNPNGVQSSHRGGLFDKVNETYPLVGAYNYANITFRSCIFDIVGPTTYGFFGYAHNDPKFYDCTFNCNGIRPIANNGKSIVVDGCVFVNQYHYSVRIYENSEETQDVVYTNNTVIGTNSKGEFEGINISKKAGTATIHANFTIKGNTSGLKYRHHSAVTMGSDCTYDTDIVNFAFEREQ